MSKFLRALCTIFTVVILVVIAFFLVKKIKDDTIDEKNKDIDVQNAGIESEYILNHANEKIAKIKSDIQKDVNMVIEVADIGSIADMDIYFVAQVDGQYKYIVKNDEGKFVIAQDNAEDAKYIVPLNVLELDKCVYTKVQNYHIDKDAVITYIEN